MQEQFLTVLESLKRFWMQFAGIVPGLLVGLVLLILGWLVARILRRILIRVLKFIRMDVAAEKAGVEDFLLQGGVRYTAVTLIADLVYWFVLFAVILAVLDSLGLRSASELASEVVQFIPNVVVATLVLMFGALFARFVRGVVFTYLSNVGITGADVISSLAQWALLLFGVSVALEQLAVGVQVIVAAFQIAFGAFCLAIAIAFGLGGKDWAAHILGRMWKK